MDYGKGTAKAMAMSEATWRRHANPWSVWTRVPILPALAVALYSHVWIGWWAALPTALLLAWTWYNPRAFPPPRSLDNWASKGVMRERLWLNRKHVPIPARHARMAHLLAGFSALGLPPLIYGLIWREPWAIVTGTVLATGGKIWFVDRMVWLYEEMKGEYPELQEPK